MTRLIVRIGLVLTLVAAIGSFVAAQKPGLKDVPLVVSFYNQLCSAGTAWCGDSLGEYESDAREKDRVVEITYFDYDENGVGVGFRFYLTSASGRTVTVKLGTPKPALPAGAWCPERCPGAPAFNPPDFSKEPITSVSVRTGFGYSEPNYDFLKPAECAMGWTDGRCASDFKFGFQTSRKEYRIRFSPNIWRELTKLDDLPGDTMPGGVVGVQPGASGSWELTPLLEHPLVSDRTGVPHAEPCPALLERLDAVKGLNTWVFLGCYDMPFGLALTRR